MKSKRIAGPLLGLALLAGLALLLYPTVSNYWNSLHRSKAVAAYVDSAQSMSGKESSDMIEKARAYNEKLLDRSLRFTMSSDERDEYNATLDVTGTGIMGCIEIPCIGVMLPIYHGTSDEVLQIAVGRIEGTSLPVGGKGCHCVLSGHRGLPNAKLFSDLYKLDYGDEFTITVLDEVLTYEVDQIRTVLPDEIDELSRDANEDYCTLVTCTPYAVNSHRLLVRGRRTQTDAPASALRITSDAYRVDPTLVAPFLFVPLLGVLTAFLMTEDKAKKKEERYLDEY